MRTIIASLLAALSALLVPPAVSAQQTTDIVLTT